MTAPTPPWRENRESPTLLQSRRLLVVLIGALALLASSCTGDSSSSTGASVIDLTRESTLDGSASKAPSGDYESSTETVEVDERGIEDVGVSTVKIEAEGSFVEVGDVTALSGQWNGTGFVIDDEGYVVTNNHVVAGAAFLKISGPGIDGVVNARVLGVSECSDLAVIDLEGSGYLPLEFRTEPVHPGLSIFAAGYPGGGGGVEDTIESRDYTVTGGIVSNTTADGRTAWASVDTVIEHDARIRGGNSGGPLVDENAQVVGINYAGADEDFNFAIAAQEAAPIIEQLKNGDTESIGINGTAYVDEEISGVWVQAVDPGSAADRSGLEAGDFILSMNDVALGENGTMASYCDIVRSQGPDDVVEIEVLRLSTDELLSGQLNGDPLAPTFSFAQEFAEEDLVAIEGDSNVYSDYSVFFDDTNSIFVELPAEWADRWGAPSDDFGPSIYAAPDVEGFLETWDIPGLIVEVNHDLGPADHDEVLALFEADCVDTGIEDFQTIDEFYTGRWHILTDCGGTDTMLVSLAVSPPDGSFVVRLIGQMITDADIEVLDNALATFDVVIES